MVIGRFCDLGITLPRKPKTGDVFKKTGDTKGTFHASVNTIKDRKDLTEAEEIKKRWQEYTELYKKSLSDLETTMVWSIR